MRKLIAPRTRSGGGSIASGALVRGIELAQRGAGPLDIAWEP